MHYNYKVALLLETGKQLNTQLYDAVVKYNAIIMQKWSQKNLGNRIIAQKRKQRKKNS